MPINQARPCPFCSSTSLLLNSDNKYAVKVTCERCGAIGPESEDETEAVENWNGQRSQRVYFDVVEK